MENTPFFNPLDKANLGKSVVDALLERPAVPLRSIKRFHGAGVYAIYYAGDFLPYAPLAKRNRMKAVVPIYVGKAIPKGGRKGVRLNAAAQSTALSSRLQEHAETIAQAENLDLDHFGCRSLVVDDIWIPLGESLLIQRYEPLWNQVVEGFGNHDPGSGRYQGQKPLWDELHPGRNWATKCMPAKYPSAEIIKLIAAYFTKGGA